MQVTSQHRLGMLFRRYFTIEELLAVFSADFIDHTYQHIVLLTESPFATIQVSIPLLNLLIIVVPSSNHYKVLYCDPCLTLGQRLTSQIPPLIKNSNPTVTPVLPRSHSHQVVLTVTLQNNPPQKSSFNSLKKSQAQETKEHPYPVITTAKSAYRPRPTGNSPHCIPQSVIKYPHIIFKHKYTTHKHNNK